MWPFPITISVGFGEQPDTWEILPDFGIISKKV
jgi:hypothetical protein